MTCIRQSKFSLKLNIVVSDNTFGLLLGCVRIYRDNQIDQSNLSFFIYIKGPHCKIILFLFSEMNRSRSTAHFVLFLRRRYEWCFVLNCFDGSLANIVNQ